MKRNFTLVLATIVLVALVFSCKKDDPAAAPSVVGTWKFTSYVAASCDDPLDEENESCGGNVAECGSLVLTATTFTNTPGSISGGGAESGTYVISGTTLTITPNGGGGSKAFTFAVTATTLTVSEDDTDTGCHTTTTFTRQ